MKRSRKSPPAIKFPVTETVMDKDGNVVTQDDGQPLKYRKVLSDPEELNNDKVAPAPWTRQISPVKKSSTDLTTADLALVTNALPALPPSEPPSIRFSNSSTGLDLNIGPILSRRPNHAILRQPDTVRSTPLKSITPTQLEIRHPPRSDKQPRKSLSSTQSVVSHRANDNINRTTETTSLPSGFPLSYIRTTPLASTLHSPRSLQQNKDDFKQVSTDQDRSQNPAIDRAGREMTTCNLSVITPFFDPSQKDLSHLSDLSKNIAHNGSQTHMQDSSSETFIIKRPSSGIGQDHLQTAAHHIQSGSSPSQVMAAQENTEMTNERSSVECVACLDVFEDAQITRLSCDCCYCSPCLNRLFRSGCARMADFPPKCHGKIISIAAYGFDLEQAVVDRYEEVAAEYGSQDPLYCAKSSCSKFLSEDNIVEEEEYAICPLCYECTCIDCKALISAHTFRNEIRECPDEPADLLALRTLSDDNYWKQCPGCLTMVEKTEGCDHVTCSCGTEFCYRCGASYDTEQWCECYLHSTDSLSEDSDGDHLA